jgi:hypothetical protein
MLYALTSPGSVLLESVLAPEHETVR